MKEISRIIKTSFWSDEKVLNDFTPEDKYFMLFLLSNEYSTQLGIYYLPIKKAALDLGYSYETVMSLLWRFQNIHHVLMYSKNSGEVAIKNYLVHSVVKGGKPVMDCLMKEEDSVIDKSLLGYIYNNLINKDIKNTTVIEYLEHLKVYKDLYIYNDNDNERIVHDSCPSAGKPVNTGKSDNELFEELWRLYPKKEGKGKVSTSQKGKIGKIGKEEMVRAITRYKDAKKNTDMRYIMMGSTFFNNGYVDYLDANYEATKQSQVSNKMSGREAFLNAGN